MKFVTAWTSEGGYHRYVDPWKKAVRKHGYNDDDMIVIEYSAPTWRAGGYGKLLCLADAYKANPDEDLVWIDVDGELTGRWTLPFDGVSMRGLIAAGTGAKTLLAGTIALKGGDPKVLAFVNCFARLAQSALLWGGWESRTWAECEVLFVALGEYMQGGGTFTELPASHCWIPAVDKGPLREPGVLHSLASKGQIGRFGPAVCPGEETLVIVPCWGDGAHMDAMLESAAAQTYRKFAMVFHLDGAPYGSLPAIDRFARDHPDIPMRVQAMHENYGTAHALNRAMEFAAGAKYITWWANDDIRHPRNLEVLVDHMRRNQGHVAVFAHYARESGQIVDGRWRRQGEPAVMRPSYRQGQLVDDINCFIGPAFLWRHDAVCRVGKHRGRNAHDYDYWLRMEEEGTIGLVPEVLATYRVHNQRTTVLRPHETDAKQWQQEARARRLAK